MKKRALACTPGVPAREVQTCRRAQPSCAFPLFFYQTAVIVVEQNVKCVKQAQTNESSSDSTRRIENCGGGDGKQVPVKKYEGFDELSWGELEGQDAAQEPWKRKLEALKDGWDAKHFDRSSSFSSPERFHCLAFVHHP